MPDSSRDEEQLFKPSGKLLILHQTAVKAITTVSPKKSRKMRTLKAQLSVFAVCVLWLFTEVQESSSGIGNMFDLRYWRCFLKKTYKCPDNDIKFYLFTHESGSKIGKRIDVRNKLALKIAGWDPQKSNAILIHGFNGTHNSPPLKLLRKAYLWKGDYNVFMVEWHNLGRFPCYLSALSNMKLTAKCTAQLYAYIMDLGGIAQKTVCVGHSLGAHICGMMSNHLTIKQHRIVGLDPARPLVDRFANLQFRLTRDDAFQVQVIHSNAGILGEAGLIGHVDFCLNGGQLQPGCYKGDMTGLDPARPLVDRFGNHGTRLTRDDAYEVQVIHTNAGTLGETGQVGHIDFCINGGGMQPGCKGHMIKRSRCSHFQSVCYFAASIKNNSRFIGHPCSQACPKMDKWGYKAGKAIPMGDDIPLGAIGQYCIKIDHDNDCPFN